MISEEGISPIKASAEIIDFCDTPCSCHPFPVTFPLYPSSSGVTLMGNIAISLRALPEHQRPGIERIRQLIAEVAESCQICPGTAREFMQRIVPMCPAKNELDAKIQHRAFFALLIKGADRPQNLSESFETLAPLPKFSQLADALNRLFDETKLSAGRADDLHGILREHFGGELLLSENLQAFSNLSSNCEDAGPVPKSLNHLTYGEIFAQARADGRRILERASTRYELTPQRYLNTYLCHARATCSRVKIFHLRKVCTALLIEQKCMGKFQSCIQRVQSELGLTKRDLRCGDLWRYLLNAYTARVEEQIKAYCTSNLLKFQFFMGVDVKVQLVCGLIEDELDRLYAVTRGSKRFSKIASQKQAELLDEKLSSISQYMQVFLKRHEGDYPKGEVLEWVRVNERFLQFFKARFHHDQMCRWLIHYQGAYIDKFDDPKWMGRSETISIPIGAWHLFVEGQKSTKRSQVNGIFAIHLQVFQDLIDLHAAKIPWTEELYRCAHKRLCQALRAAEVGESEKSSAQRLLTLVEGQIDLPPDLGGGKQLESNSRVSGQIDCNTHERGEKSEIFLDSNAPQDADATVADSPPESASLCEISAPFVATLTSYEQLLEHSATRAFPFAYAERVLRWFSASAPLNDRIFDEYGHLGFKQQQFEIAKHGFSRLADLFCHRALTFVKTLPATGKQLRNFVLPAEITWERVTRRGYLSWVVNHLDVCFHRYFHVKSSEDSIDVALRQKFNESDFPVLGASAPLGREAHWHVGNFRVEIDDFLEIATIAHISNGAQFKVFLMGPSVGASS